MFRSIHSKVIGYIFIIMFLMGLVIIYTTNLTLDNELFLQEKSEAHNILHLIMVNLQHQYDNYLKFKEEIIEVQRRKLVESVGSVTTLLEMMVDYHKNQLVDFNEAKELGLDYIKDSNIRYDTNFFIFDMDRVGVYHNDPKRIGAQWDDFTDLKGYPALEKVLKSTSNQGYAFSVFYWHNRPAEPLTKHLAYFKFFPKWGWIVGDAVPIEDLEVKSEEKKQEILKGLANTFSEISGKRTGWLVLFNGAGRVMLYRSNTDFDFNRAVNHRTGNSLIEELKKAAKSPDIPFEYTRSTGKTGETAEYVAFVRYFKALDWYLCYSLSKQDLKRLAGNLAFKQVSLILIIFTISAITIYHLTKRITRPLDVLTQYTDALITQDFRPEPEAERSLSRLIGNRKDDISRLAKSFQLMNQALKKYVGELWKSKQELESEVVERRRAEMELSQYKEHLEELVARRTRELEETNQQLQKEINERLRIDIELQASEDKFRNLVQSMNEGLIALDENDIVTFANKSFLEMVGRAESELIHRPIDFNLRGKVKDKMREELALRRQGRQDVYEYQFTRSDGKQIWARVNPKVLKDEAGRYKGVISLVSDITEEKAAQGLIRQALREKEILLREIHHRVKNNMQVISSLLNLQANQIEDERLFEVFQESQNRVYAMALIHEILYRSDSLSAIDLQEYVDGLVAALSQVYDIVSQRIELRSYVAKIELSLDRAIPTGLIINELLVNSLKYAFPDGRAGRITISAMALNEKRIELIVSDSGVGMPPGLDWRNCSSLGLQLVVGLVENQLMGNIVLEQDVGTSFRISFKHG